ncbi:MAG: PilC/PilY family type IV pilus protein [Rhodoferax sp.]|nr:PilC/PilY family type IV pilus protein [Rhodoferax sp.]
MKTKATLILRAVLCIAFALLAVSNTPAATTQISSVPLATSSSTAAKPNIFYVLDDSGSMAWNYLPDWANTDYSVNNYNNTITSGPVFQNNGYNGLAYNPATTYTPPVTYANVSYTSMTSANTSTWSKVPIDGFGVQSTGTSNLVGKASYYTFIAGEYCADRHQTTCVPQSAPSASYPYPAYLRWCTDSTLTVCQAIQFNTAPTGGSTYMYARYPGYGTNVSSTTTLKVSGSTSTSVGSIMVNGLQILSAATTAATSSTTVASAIVTNINKCTSATTGNCTVAGYSATSSSGTVTITAPASLGAITYTPVVSQSGTMTITAKAFSGGSSQVPGSNLLTTITSTTTSYPYPGTSTKASTRTDCAGTTCTYAEEMTNYANWYAYYQTRMQMVKSAATLAFSALTTSYRIGYMSINNNTGTDFLNISDITTGSTGQMAAWYAKFTAATPNNGTDTRMALSTAGQYYAGKRYNTKINGTTANDPMQYSCQRNYTILSTDGYWNEGNTTTTATDTPVPANAPNSYNSTLSGIVTLSASGTGSDLGDQDGGSTTLPYSEGSTKTYNTMADIAYYYHNTDIRDPSLKNNCINSTSTCTAANDVSAGTQNMSTSTMGLGDSGFMQYQRGYAAATSGDYFNVVSGNTAVISSTTPSTNVCNWQAAGTVCSWPVPVSNQQTAIDDLWHTAVNGHGTYYSAQNPVDVKNGMTNFLSTITATLGSSAAATVSSPNLTTGSNSQYQATFVSQYWYGELAEYALNPVTGVQSTYAAWSESGIVKASATANTTPLLDNLAYTSRNIYTYDATKSSGSLTSFTWASLSPTVQGYFQIAAISGSASPPALSQLTTGNVNLLPAAAQVNSSAEGTTNGAGGANLVAYLSGDRANEAPAGGSYYRQRLHVLGDIVDSQPVYVAAPSFSYTDPGYAAFQSSQSSRTGMLYVGANDGMLHGFNGSTGAETWDYIPSMVLPNMYQLADMNYATQHAFFVDGSPVSSDVCVANCTSSTTASWRTILVGGLGAGGRGYYALDVTNPSTPALLWEFTYDTTKSGIGHYITDQDLGLSFGTPVITKLSDGTWAVLVTSGYNNVSPGTGNGIVWVLNAQTGAIIKKINTGVGSTGTPSGLAQISAYTPNGAINNTASFVYGGDLNGNLWRMNISGLTATGGTVITQLLTTLQDPSNNPQPITITPQLGNTNGNVVVYMGTGQYLGGNDPTSTQVQSLYAIKDPLTVTASPLVTPVYGNPHNNTCASGLSINCFVKNTLTDTSGVITVSSSVTPNFSTMNGWFEDLPESGARISTNLQLQLGILSATVNIPGASSSACSAGGTSYPINSTAAAGLALPGFTNVGAYFSVGGTMALGNASTLYETSNGTVIAVTTLKNGQVVYTNLGKGTPGKGTRRISWRELMTN